MRVVNAVDVLDYVGSQLLARNTPVHDFGVSVAEVAGGLRGLGVVSCPRRVGMERDES